MFTRFAKIFVAAAAVFVTNWSFEAAGLVEQAEAREADDELQDLAARFGIRETILDISLSPSGNKIAFVSAGPEHTDLLKVIDLAGAAQLETIVTNDEKNVDISQCEWATEQRLVCEIYGLTERADGVLLGFSRVFAVNDDGSDFLQLTERRSSGALSFNQDGGDVLALDVEGEAGRILMTREYVREYSTGTRLANDREGIGVDQVNVENARRSSEEDPDAMASRYYADQFGKVRLKIRSLADERGVRTGRLIYMYRPLDGSRWQRLEDLSIEGGEAQGFYPVAVDSVRDVVFGFVTKDGFRALAEFKLDGTGEGKLLLARSDVDVDQLIRIGRQRRVVGASFATEKRQVAYFDQELKALAVGLSQALPSKPLINIVGASSDENRLLIVASSDTQPGMAYLFDKTAGSLEPLLPVRDYLSQLSMGQMSPVLYRAQDGTEIPGYLTLPPGGQSENLPAVVLPHGGPAARDEWGFDWLVQFLVSRGYAVLQPNYRGSSGYGEAWYGRNGYQAWNVAINDVNDAGRWLVSEGIADPSRLAIVGWSYGGYAALQSQVVDPDLFHAVVAIAPVTDLEYLREDARAYVNFRARDRQLGRGDHIAAGSPRRHTDRFKAPVALFHGTLDANVRVRHSRAMRSALEDSGKDVTYVEFDGLQHGLRDSKARTEMLAEIDQFLAAALEE